MSGLSEIHTSLAVGFPDGALPESFVRLRGREHRSISAQAEFPYEDEQFEVVLLNDTVISRASVHEAHRVLRPNGRLFFRVDEKTSSSSGYQLPTIYALVRDGFDILQVQRSAWWRRLLGERPTFSICARKKKNWRPYKGFGGGGVLLSPFQNR